MVGEDTGWNNTMLRETRGEDTKWWLNDLVLIYLLLHNINDYHHEKIACIPRIATCVRTAKHLMQMQCIVESSLNHISVPIFFQIRFAIIKDHIYTAHNLTAKSRAECARNTFFFCYVPASLYTIRQLRSPYLSQPFLYQRSRGRIPYRLS